MWASLFNDNQLSRPLPIIQHCQFMNCPFELLITVMSHEFRWTLNMYWYQTFFSFIGCGNCKPGHRPPFIFSHLQFILYSEIKSKERPMHRSAMITSSCRSDPPGTLRLRRGHAGILTIMSLINTKFYRLLDDGICSWALLWKSIL